MLKGILSVSGQSGLFKLLTEAKNSIVVESLDTGKRMPVYSTSKISSLEDIAIYTENSDVPIKDIFKAISEKENGGPSISEKSSAGDLKKYFESVVPTFDRDRVYVSDMKKVITWYNSLQQKGMLDFTEVEVESKEEEKKTE